MLVTLLSLYGIDAVDADNPIQLIIELKHQVEGDLIAFSSGRVSGPFPTPAANAEAKGSCLSEIEARLWPNTKPPKNRLNVVVSEARSALGDANKEPRKFIATLGEDGYCFIHPIKRVERATGSYDDIEAEREYRAGMRCLENREDESLRKALACFKRAISKNPAHPLAWVGLGEAYLILGIHCVDAPQDTFPKALAAAKEATAGKLPDKLGNSRL